MAKSLADLRSSQPGAKNPPEPSADEDVGNFKIVRLLGSGATSNVYLGLDKASMKLAAIKMIRPECAIDMRASLV